MFLAKKILSRIFFPVPLTLEVLLMGLFLLWFTRRQRAGKLLVTCGTLMLMCFSSLPVSSGLLRPLEHRYPPLLVSAGGENVAGMKYIAVLGGFGDHDPEVSIASHVAPDLMVRLVEGVRLHRQIPGSKLILSGSHDSAAGMAEVAETLGVNKEDILLLAEPRDTQAESRQVAPIVGKGRFILVTSASHMGRAMTIFHRQGLDPLAAPTDYLAPRHGLEFDDLVPDGYKLFKSQIAVYEYLGQAWEALRGMI